jgi:SIR2-like domain
MMADSSDEIALQDDEGGSKYRLLDATGRDQLRDAQDAHRRLQALIANWLRMENVVCLLGAGTCVTEAIGGKTIGQLEDAVLSIVGEKWKDSQPIKNLIEARQEEKTESGSLGFEQWLSVMSNISSLLAQKGTPVQSVSFKVDGIEVADLDRLLKDIEASVYGLCSLELNAPADQPSGHHAFFGKLIARDPSLGRSQIFTLNYDTVIEQALDHLGIFYFDGFSGRVEPKFDPTCYGLDLYFPGDVSEGRVRRFDRFVHLYKLHGSVHWIRSPDGRITARQPDLSRLKKWRTDSDGANKAKDLASLWPVDEGHLGILPTANKFVQTLEAPFSHLFRLFQHRLQSPQTFMLVCGYGFGDDHVNSMIEAGLLNVSVTLLIVTPECLDFETGQSLILKWMKRHQHLGERIFVLCPSKVDGAMKVATFDDFASNVMPQVKWLDEFAALRRLEKTIEPTVHEA